MKKGPGRGVLQDGVQKCVRTEVDNGKIGCSKASLEELNNGVIGCSIVSLGRRRIMM
ncbi:hypothetical protein [Chitinophaga sp.]|uniref:hypothetical protein n=1 Tax=Chitinophaga sp. TaxID=1869181 RepID=UPI0031CFAB69